MPVASPAVCRTVVSSVVLSIAKDPLFCPASRGASLPAGRVGPAPAAALEEEPEEPCYVVSQKFVDEVSPSADGRKRVAHSSQPWVGEPSLPRPLSRPRGRGVPKAG